MNVSIQEGSIARNFSPTRLKTALQGGGNCMWVPEDSVKTKQLRVDGNGTYTATQEEVYAFSKVTVTGKSDSETQLIEKNINENGTFKASDENAYGYSKVRVSVPGGGDYVDPDTGETVESDPSDDTGSAIVGTDPDGNEEVVEVHEDDELVKIKLASYILLDTPPNKLEYKDGERIVMQGAVVRGYLKDGTPYKNSSYQDSILPFTQHDTPHSDSFIPGGVVMNEPLRADINKVNNATVEDVTSADLKNTISVPFGMCMTSHIILSAEDEGSKREYLLSEQVQSAAFKYDNGTRIGVYVILASETGFTVNGLSSEIARRQDRTYYYYWLGLSPSFHRDVIVDGSVVNNFVNGKASLTPTERTEIAYEMLFSPYIKSGGQIITLIWPREGDRKFLKTEFEITVTEN